MFLLKCLSKPKNQKRVQPQDAIKAGSQDKQIQILQNNSLDQQIQTIGCHIDFQNLNKIQNPLNYQNTLHISSYGNDTSQNDSIGDFRNIENKDGMSQDQNSSLLSSRHKTLQQATQNHKVDQLLLQCESSIHNSFSMRIPSNNFFKNYEEQSKQYKNKKENQSLKNKNLEYFQPNHIHDKSPKKITQSQIQSDTHLNLLVDKSQKSCPINNMITSHSQKIIAEISGQPTTQLYKYQQQQQQLNNSNQITQLQQQQQYFCQTQKQQQQLKILGKPTNQSTMSEGSSKSLDNYYDADEINKLIEELLQLDEEQARQRLLKVGNMGTIEILNEMVQILQDSQNINKVQQNEIQIKKNQDVSNFSSSLKQIYSNQQSMNSEVENISAFQLVKKVTQKLNDSSRGTLAPSKLIKQIRESIKLHKQSTLNNEYLSQISVQEVYKSKHSINNFSQSDIRLNESMSEILESDGEKSLNCSSLAI